MKHKKLNTWYAYEDENGSTKWDEINFDTFASWMGDLTDVDSDTAVEFCDNMIDLAIAEKRHIPIETYADFVELANGFVDEWKERN